MNNIQNENSNDHGFYDAETKKFYVIRCPKLYAKLIRYKAAQEKKKRDDEFQRRLETEKYDDFDYIVEEISNMMKGTKEEELRLIEE